MTHWTPTPTLPTAGRVLERTGDRSWTARSDTDGLVRLTFPKGPAFALDGTDELHVLPGDQSEAPLLGRGTAWVLPEAEAAGETAWLVQADGPIEVRFQDACVVMVVTAGQARLTSHRARPHSDVLGQEYSLDLDGGPQLADALAGFYWGTMLPCVVERTVAAEYADSSGYVVSTLADRYLGTYPDVDHEFQIKGRLAAGSRLDLHVVRRMIELQLRLMREDPQSLWRDPCAVQPDGTREYHVRRNSLDGSTNAVMFLITGNVGVLESIWLYVARTKDHAWLRDRIHDIEGAASCIEDCIDRSGRLWSDVYYEDQVIKDGRETMSAALTVRSFELLAELESLIGRHEQAAHFRTQAARVSSALSEPLPHGYWNTTDRRFVDWVDRSGGTHDHLHLLANQLPVLVGATTPEQTADVLELVSAEIDEYQRFPTFLAARVQDYTDAEIGDGGPYDLCAAGRYWCWDAAFWSSRNRGDLLLQQLQQVAAQASTEQWIMGERYDVGHVYYVDDSPWHGAAHYYEYPCVFTWVLLTEFLGVRASLRADLLLAPRITGPGGCTLEQDAYRLRYSFDGHEFSVENLAHERRRFELDLTSLLPRDGGLLTGLGRRLRTAGDIVTLEPGETIRVTASDPSGSR